MYQIKFLKFGIARRFRMAQMAFSLRNADFIEAWIKPYYSLIWGNHTHVNINMRVNWTFYPKMGGN